MTQEEDLLIKDLSARIFYGTRVKVSNIWDEDKEIEKDIEDVLYCVLPDGYVNTSTIDSDIPIKDVKPYLRPLSSMTKKEIGKYKCLNDALDENYEVHIDNAYPAFDWLNKNHFDYRGLIPMNLALEAPEGMYN